MVKTGPRRAQTSSRGRGRWSRRRRVFRGRGRWSRRGVGHLTSRCTSRGGAARRSSRVRRARRPTTRCPQHAAQRRVGRRVGDSGPSASSPPTRPRWRSARQQSRRTDIVLDADHESSSEPSALRPFTGRVHAARPPRRAARRVGARARRGGDERRRAAVVVRSGRPSEEAARPATPAWAEERALLSEWTEARGYGNAQRRLAPAAAAGAQDRRLQVRKAQAG